MEETSDLQLSSLQESRSPQESSASPIEGRRINHNKNTI